VKSIIRTGTVVFFFCKKNALAIVPSSSKAEEEEGGEEERGGGDICPRDVGQRGASCFGKKCARFSEDFIPTTFFLRIRWLLFPRAKG
jgi:hypothetical protein